MATKQNGGFGEQGERQGNSYEQNFKEKHGRE